MALVVHEVEFAATENRRWRVVRRRGDAGPKEIRGENDQIEDRKADAESLNFHIPSTYSLNQNSCQKIAIKL